MRQRTTSIRRQGQIYRFVIDGISYAAFIWQRGKQFQGRIEGQPGTPQCTGRTALAVRDALHAWLTAEMTVSSQA